MIIPVSWWHFLPPSDVKFPYSYKPNYRLLPKEYITSLFRNCDLDGFNIFILVTDIIIRHSDLRGMILH